MTILVQPTEQDPQAQRPTVQEGEMDLAVLEEYITNFAVNLAALTITTEGFTPLLPDQLQVVFFSALATYAKTRPDYNPNTVVTEVLQLGVAVYAQAIYAQLQASVSDQEEFNQELKLLGETAGALELEVTLVNSDGQEDLGAQDALRGR